MQTQFTPDQLRDPAMARSNDILRACVHCGMCTATCPSYQVLGNELDSPRGRIYLIKDMLENERIPDDKTVLHIDRCLSCLACMTTCPSGVHYMHLIDHARAYIEKHHQRPVYERALRRILAEVLPYPGRFRLAMMAAKLARPFRRLMPDKRLTAMLDMAAHPIPPVSRNDRPGQIHHAQGSERGRVALMTGCAQRALNTDINDATIRLLTRLGITVVIAEGAGCCGALAHHMGQEGRAQGMARSNIQAWQAAGPVDAVIINASGCGTTVKDYGHMMTGDDQEAAAEIAAKARDITEYLTEIGYAATTPQQLRVGYHPACSLQHGQKVTEAPKALLQQAGFEVVTPREAHLCCGSAGTYNIMQPEIAGPLGDRKAAHLAALAPDVIATGNIGCMVQIAARKTAPVVHTVELLDWAHGGPKPRALAEEPRPGHTDPPPDTSGH